MTDAPGYNPFPKPEHLSPRWRRPPRWLVLSVVALLVIGAAVVVVRAFECGGPGNGISSVDGQCVGITDGDAYVFDPALRDIQAKIAKENADIGSAEAVTIAVLNPMTADASSALTTDEIRNMLEGAYLAQLRVNHSHFVDDPRPMIRLVLANEGSHQDQWEGVVDDLIDMVDDPQPLVAVVGFGVSVTQTRLAAMRLAEYQIPMVAAITTADELTYANIPGYIRVSPSNAEYVAALKDYLDRHPELTSAMVVYDANSDIGTNPDLFTRSLHEDLDTGLRDLIKAESQRYTGASVASDATPNMFGSITSNICAVRPKVVLFAGRQTDMKVFLESLASRACKVEPITVATAGSDLGALRTIEDQLRQREITLVYAATTDVEGWVDGVPGTPDNFDEFLAAFDEQGFNRADLADGNAMSMHDAVFAAVKAVRLAQKAGPSPKRGALPKRADVLTQLLNLTHLNFVRGATGDLRFSSRGNQSGNPIGKPIPVLAIPRSGADPHTEPPPYLTK